MPDAFFASDKKRKRSRPGAAGRNGRSGGPSSSSSLPRVSKARVQAAKDEELDSDDGGLEMGDIDDMDFQRDRAPIALDDDEFVDANETAAEKRVRLARGYLDKVAKEVAEGECRERARLRASWRGRDRGGVGCGAAMSAPCPSPTCTLGWLQY